MAVLKKLFEVKPYGVKYICDSCEEGEMLPTGKAYWSDPPKFEHACNQCSAKLSLSEKYPVIRYQFNNDKN
ncbi:hypothetical protein [Bacillus sp. GMa5/1]|uniref:hypothetical protein n=1 Tax=Bacillus sp. GMa5/1 TaxID=3418496 RepID=UPI003CFB1E49